MLTDVFQSDNFTNYKIKYRRPKKTQIKELNGILKLFSKKYVLRNAVRVEGTGINSSNYKIHVAVNGKLQKFLLRKTSFKRNKTLMQTFFNFIKSLPRRGVPTPILKNINKNYLLFDFIDGEHFKPDEKIFRALAKSVAFMHRGFKKVNAAEKKQLRGYSDAGNCYFNYIKKYDAADFNKIADILAAKSKNTPEEQLFLHSLKLIKRIIARIRAEMSNIQQLPTELIHSDLHPHNVLVKDDNSVLILDFESIRFSQQARDAASAIYRFGRQFLLKTKTKKMRIRRAHRLKNIFIKEYVKINQLTQNEIKLMPTLLLDEFLIKLLSTLEDSFLNHDATWAKDIPKFVLALEEISYFWSAS